MNNSISRNYGNIEGKPAERLDLHQSLDLILNCSQQNLSLH